MPHTPHAVHVFPSEQFVSRWTEAIMYATIMYATHTTRSARFLQSSSCPDGLRQSCMPHTPHAVHISLMSRWTDDHNTYHITRTCL